MDLVSLHFPRYPVHWLSKMLPRLARFGDQQSERRSEEIIPTFQNLGLEKRRRSKAGAEDITGVVSYLTNPDTVTFGRAAAWSKSPVNNISRLGSTCELSAPPTGNDSTILLEAGLFTSRSDS